MAQLACAVLALGLSSPAQSAEPAVVNGLKFSIALKEGGAVAAHLLARLENAGKDDALVWGRSCSWGHGRISVQFAGVEVERARKWTEPVGEWRRNVPLAQVLKPGDAQEVALNMEEFRLQPGEWDATATYSSTDDGAKIDFLMRRTENRKVWTGSVSSNTVRLKIPKAAGNVSVILKPSKAEYAAGEAVDLELTVKNGGDADSTFSTLKARYLSDFALFGPDGGPVELAINPVEIDARDTPKTLKPGEEFTMTLNAVNLEKPPGSAGFIRHVRYPMEKPGAYSATIKVGGVMSEEAVFKVAAPAPAKP